MGKGTQTVSKIARGRTDPWMVNQYGEMIDNPVCEAQRNIRRRNVGDKVVDRVELITRFRCDDDTLWHALVALGGTLGTGCETCLHIIERQSTLRVGLIGIVGWQRLIAKPVLQGTVPGLERTQAIADDLALARIFA